ncbi:Nicotinamide riboside transporter PnuC [Aquisphaera giovannonii]|uniref:Nicotinamide riboside transporter PnuC n=1 Tax=Aquisphaera giovannonii TaxID=406548 RepID=A0A5B9W2M3_9BACT|nr:nicotinamide riboside transporter PnuC [Aquisphaera giovannonii]QEH34467.1 Nicotinamide riboside transporter PnuC [Aquisphaera giovannonii]
MSGGRRLVAMRGAALIGLVASVALGMAAKGAASPLEAASFVTGAACVWLTVKENPWNFPIGLVNVATFLVVFARAGLLADAGLQAVYFVLGCRGWYLWVRGGEDHAGLRVAGAGVAERLGVALAVVAMTAALWPVLARSGGSAPFWDALTTSISLGAQWLLNRKRPESWLAWILVDAIYVPLYASKSLHLTAVLYAIFLGMAVMGLLEWRGREATAKGQPEGEVAG